MRVARAAVVAVVLTFLLAISASVSADVIYQSALMGSPGSNGGAVVDSEVYLGKRFQVTQTMVATGIGGHFGTFTTPGQSIFGAIIRLDNFSDFPNTINPLNSSDVLAVGLVPMPANYYSADLTAPINPVTLMPGTYAILFGSGQFGATGEGFATQNNSSFGFKSEFFYYQVNGIQYLDTSFVAQRFVVYGEVPEPGSFGLLMALLSAPMLMRRARAIAR